ncbi:MAG TPA: DUF2865 domain-containing protein [Xanthobacteraceae bacterium]|nr:DUF2865 domain-containing protein [Xanthobacteraceae bacterium]
MIKLLRSLGRLTLCAVAFIVFAAPAAAQGLPPDQSANSVCARLEGQLAIVDRGTADPARAELIQHAEDAVARQQADLDRTLAQSRRQGCEGIGGFFALFTGQAPQCQPLNAQIQQMRGNLDRMMSDLERLKSGNTDQDSRRRALIAQLAQNNCGPQYSRAAAAAGQGGGFLDTLFGRIINPAGDGAPAGTYRTVCVRTCDGYFFPISYSTVPDHFPEDQRACQRLCPAAEAALYTYRNPGEDISQAVSLGGRTYTELPNAFLYRREFSAACSCRRPGQSWAEALKNADDSSTLERGDIIVTEETAKALSQPQKGAPGAPGTVTGKPPPKASANPPDASAPAAPAADADQAKDAVRTVGPPFVAAH